MGGMELMAANVLKALGIDPDALKTEFEGRVKQFEQNISALNASLAQINERLSRIENALNIPPQPQQENTANGREQHLINNQ